MSPATVSKREQADARQVGAVEVSVRAPEELVAAADREHRGTAAAARRTPAAFASQILRDERLLAVLPAADVEEIVLAGWTRISDRNGPDLELVAAPRRAPRQDRDVAAVGIDVQIVGIEMPDDDLHAARSQYGRTNPRSLTICRKPSIAVYVGRTTSSPPGGVSSSPRSSAASSEGTTSIALSGRDRRT